MCMFLHVEERPSMKQLDSVMRKEYIAPKWYQLGLQLMNNSGHLEVIKESCQEVTERCLRMFLKWLEVTPSASWSDLITALHETELHTAANAVRKLQNPGIICRKLSIMHTYTCYYYYWNKVSYLHIF